MAAASLAFRKGSAALWRCLSP